MAVALLNNLICETDKGISTVPLTEERAFGLWQRDIPAEYRSLDSRELTERIGAARAALGTRAVVLGHHYQREDIIAFADFRGDSFKLSQWAAEQTTAEFIIFCGVHFMAEAADILRAPHQKVILPNMAAGCSMADMASSDDVFSAWDELHEAGITDIVPVTYMNSAASLKAFVGKNGGIVCTSSNARAVLEWAYARGQRVFFFPDQHLGRNTGARMGVGLDEMAVWDYKRPYGDLGGNPLEVLERSRMILWKGHCSVHARFSVEQIQKARAEYPDVNVIVHPECRLEVVQAADYDGSTEYIVKIISDAPAGSTWAVGTEINLVHRLAVENPDKRVFCLDPVVCPCSTMYRVHPAYLAWVLEGLVRGEVINQVTVDEDIKRDARTALERMLAVR